MSLRGVLCRCRLVMVETVMMKLFVIELTVLWLNDCNGCTVSCLTP